MNTKTVFGVTAFLALSLAFTQAFAAEIGRVELNGREIILNDDKSWEYAAPAEPATKTSGECTKIDSKQMPMSFCLDSQRWAISNVHKTAELQFNTKDQLLYALFIPEEQFLETEEYKKAILANAQNAAGLKPIDILVDSSASIDGTRFSHVVYRADLDDLDFTYSNYFTSLKGTGSMQIVFFSETSKYEQIKPLIEEVMAAVDMKL